MITDNELDEIQARADAATPGPWVLLGNSVAQQVDHCTCAGHIPYYGHEPHCGLWGPIILEAHQTDAVFIAHARTDVPRLIAEIRRAKAECWDEGYIAGHEDARAVQPAYPQPTLNPYGDTQQEDES